MTASTTPSAALPTLAEYAAYKDLCHALIPNALCERNPQRLSLGEMLAAERAKLAAK